jgi:predicted DNA-binding protein YlxM (UPF0122 family)
LAALAMVWGLREYRDPVSAEEYDSGDYTVQQIADEFGVTRPTIYRHLSKVPSETQVPA